MAKKEERVLLYQFPPEHLPAAQTALRALGIRVQILPPDAWREKVGYLLGLKGYRPALPADEAHFDFPHEVMLLEHIRGKRLTKVLTALAEAGVPRISYKSSITPYNTLWTLRYLCEHMSHEPGAALKDESRD